MVMLWHQGNTYTKKKLWAWTVQKCIPLVGTITQLICAGRQITASLGRRFGPTTESCLNLDGTIAKVPYLHQGTIYTKRKLRAWRDQKCIQLVSALTPLTCTGRQNTPSRERGGLGPERKVALIGTELSPWYRVCTKEIFIPK